MKASTSWKEKSLKSRARDAVQISTATDRDRGHRGPRSKCSDLILKILILFFFRLKRKKKSTRFKKKYIHTSTLVKPRKKKCQGFEGGVFRINRNDWTASKQPPTQCSVFDCVFFSHRPSFETTVVTTTSSIRLFKRFSSLIKTDWSGSDMFKTFLFMMHAL